MVAETTIMAAAAEAAGETDGEAAGVDWVAEADSMFGLFVETGTPGSEHGCIPRGLWLVEEGTIQID